MGKSAFLYLLPFIELPSHPLLLLLPQWMRLQLDVGEGVLPPWRVRTDGGPPYNARLRCILSDPQPDLLLRPTRPWPRLRGRQPSGDGGTGTAWTGSVAGVGGVPVHVGNHHTHHGPPSPWRMWEFWLSASPQTTWSATRVASRYMLVRSSPTRGIGGYGMRNNFTGIFIAVSFRESCDS